MKHRFHRRRHLLPQGKRQTFGGSRSIWSTLLQCVPSCCRKSDDWLVFLPCGRKADLLGSILVPQIVSDHKRIYLLDARQCSPHHMRMRRYATISNLALIYPPPNVRQGRHQVRMGHQSFDGIRIPRRQDVYSQLLGTDILQNEAVQVLAAAVLQTIAEALIEGVGSPLGAPTGNEHVFSGRSLPCCGQFFDARHELWIPMGVIEE
mmetsp:Transcript_93/g.265  ORF Transcript_93/g.265 Transcript_93/m.265 type:complete len:206 (+) Transcript_93:259-876(+)